MNTRISKLLVLVLALVMVVSVFAGCNSTDPTVAPTNKPTTGATTGSTEGGEPASIFPLAEKKTYTIMVKGTPDWETQKAKNLWYQDLVKRTNVEIEFVGLGSDAASQLNSMFVGKTYGHAYIGNVLNASQVVEAAAGGYLLPLENYLTEDIMPGYVSRAVAALPGLVQGSTTPDGHMYTLPRVNIDGYGHVESPLAINTEWMAKAGLSDVSTLENFEKYLKYVKENDVNGNGDANDEIPFLVVGTSSLDAQATLQGILGWWGLPTKDGASEYYCVVTDGEVDLAPRTEAYRAAITKIAEWYEKGYLWAEFYTGNTAAMASLLRESAIPVVGAFNSSAWDIANLEIYGDTDINNTKNDGVMKFVDPPAVEGYTARLFVNPAINGYRDCYAITNKCSEEDAKILLAWMDMAMFTLEGTVSADKGPADAEDRLDGFTNVWDWGEDGKPVLHAITEDQYWDNADLMSVFPDTVGSFYYLYVPEDYGEDGWMNMAMRLQEIRDGNHQWDNTELWPRPYYTEDVSIEISYLWPDIKSVITQYETQFIKGELEINDTNWNEYQKALYKAQIGRLVDLLQETYDATV